jgi:hypothetical protein
MALLHEAERDLIPTNECRESAKLVPAFDGTKQPQAAP